MLFSLSQRERACLPAGRGGWLTHFVQSLSLWERANRN